MAEAIFRSRIPVISAIGHETDLSVADMVADLRAGTPSIAAERAVPDRSEIMRQIESQLSRQSILMEGMISGAQLQVDSICNSYAFNRPVLMLGQFDERLATSEKEMTRTVSEKFRQQEQIIEAASDRLGMLDVRRVLKRGFAIVSQKGGGYVTAAASLTPGSEIGIAFHDGVREASVKG